MVIFIVSENGIIAGPSKKKAIIGGVAGGVALIIAVVVFIVLFRLSRRNKARKGNILGATELRGPVNFGYKDLKSATGSFSEAHKLGEGGFGDVYKVYMFALLLL